MRKVGKNYDGVVLYLENKVYIAYLNGDMSMRSQMTPTQWAHFKKNAKKYYTK